MPKCSFFNNLGEKITLSSTNQSSENPSVKSLQSQVSTIDKIMYYDQLTSSFVVGALGGIQKILNLNYSSINLIINLLPSMITVLNTILKQQVSQATSQLSGVPTYKLGAHMDPGSNQLKQLSQTTAVDTEAQPLEATEVSALIQANTNQNSKVTTLNEAMLYLQLFGLFCVLGINVVKANYFNSDSNRDKEVGTYLDLAVWGLPVLITFINTVLKSVRDSSIEEISPTPSMNLN